MDRQLIDYLPEILKKYAEFKELAKVEQPQVEELWDNIDRLMLEAFVQDESEIGAGKWEHIMNIEPFDTDTLAIRNLRIHGRMLEDVPYTYRFLRNQLEALCGAGNYTMVLVNDDFLLKVRVSLKQKQLINEVGKMVERITPINLILDVDLAYNTHRMLRDYKLTHRQLGNYTFGSIKTTYFGD